METTRSIIEEIFLHPPVSEAELKQRLSAANSHKARLVLVERLQSTQVCEDEYALFLEVFSSIGIGEQRPGLLEIATNREIDALARTLAMTLLAEDDPEYLNQEFDDIDPEEFALLADRPLVELMTSIEVNPDAAEELTEFLLETPDELRGFLLSRLGTCRKELGVSALAAYRHALQTDELLPLHEAMVNAIIEEGAQDGIKLLNKLRDAALDANSRKLFQGAIMRMETRAIDPKYSAKSPKGIAYVGSCDGQGTFVVLGSFKRPNGFATTANLCIQAAGDIRDGYVIPRHSSRELKEMINQLRERTFCDFAVVSLELAASIVSAAEERTEELNLPIPDDSRSAVHLFRQIKKSSTDPFPTVKPMDEVTPVKIKKLLQKPIYTHWFFDMGDLNEAKLRLPLPKKPSKKWMKTSVAMLDIPSIRNRVAAMAQHMQYWHSYRGEDELASICAAQSQMVLTDFQNSYLVEAMLCQTVERSLDLEDEEIRVFGAPETRQYLKSRFFQNLKIPKGRHLALLDFTEVALSYLDNVMSIVPSERRPRDEEKPLISYTISKSFWRMLGNKGVEPFEASMEKTAGALYKVCRLKKQECRKVSALIVLELNTFVREICSRCPVLCLERPESRMSDHFFSPHHPISAFMDEDDYEVLEEDCCWDKE